MSGFFHDRQLVQWLCVVRDGGAEFFGLPGDWPGGCKVARVDVLEGDPERSENAVVSCRSGKDQLMTGLIAIILGSVIGGAARYFVSGFVARKVGETFPWGTLTIGFIGGLAKDSTSVFASPNVWLFAVPGILGCYTTVSSFSLQTLSLARDGEGNRAFLYVVFSVALSLGAATLGFALADLIR
jgi:fluoride exporter